MGGWREARPTFWCLSWLNLCVVSPRLALDKYELENNQLMVQVIMPSIDYMLSRILPRKTLQTHPFQALSVATTSHHPPPHTHTQPSLSQGSHKSMAMPPSPLPSPPLPMSTDSTLVVSSDSALASSASPYLLVSATTSSLESCLPGSTLGNVPLDSSCATKLALHTSMSATHLLTFLSHHLPSYKSHCLTWCPIIRAAASSLGPSTACSSRRSPTKMYLSL